MKLLQQKPGEQKCLLYCAAMLLDIDIEVVERYIGYSGMEEWWPDLEGNRKYRGIHIQEIQDLFITYGKGLCCIEQHPYLSPTEDIRFAKSIFDPERAVLRFYTRLIGHTGILIYRSHAKVMDIYGSLYDPSSSKILQITPNESFKCREAWLLSEIKSNCEIT